ncbi:MAG: succinate dehydrogenase, cytochrome b556 subunit [Pseudomonadota bacterium]
MAGSEWTDPRPLSPHLQIWKYHATMAASITHRATGIAMYFGSFLIAAWIISLAAGPEAYGFVETVIQHPLSNIVLFLWAVAVMFHLANGIKYLFWDGPKIGFSPKVASGVAVFNYIFAVAAAAGIFAAAALIG